MSRARNIKPGFFKNDQIGQLPFQHRLLFIGLWCEADREGRLADRPKMISAALFPHDDDVDVNGGLDQLHETGLIVRYQIAGRRYIHVTNFNKHQRPHVKETASEIPPPSDPELAAAAKRQWASPGEVSAMPGKGSGSTGLICPFPYASSGLPSKKVAQASPVPSQSQSDKPSPAFSKFWDLYPIKKNKSAARMAWNEGECDALASVIYASIRLMAAEDVQWKAGYIFYPARYLKERHWEDEPQRAGTTVRDPAALALLALGGG